MWVCDSLYIAVTVMELCRPGMPGSIGDSISIKWVVKINHQLQTASLTGWFGYLGRKLKRTLQVFQAAEHETPVKSLLFPGSLCSPPRGRPPPNPLWDVLLVLPVIIMRHRRWLAQAAHLFPQNPEAVWGREPCLLLG